MGFAYPIIILVFTHLFQRREAVTTDGGEIAIIEDGIVFHRAMHKLNPQLQSPGRYLLLVMSQHNMIQQQSYDVYPVCYSQHDGFNSNLSSVPDLNPQASSRVPPTPATPHLCPLRSSPPSHFPTVRNYPP